MDLSYGPEYEDFRQEVRGFLEANWPPKDDEDGSREEQSLRFRAEAVEAGYLLRSVPKLYGGAEQPADALKATVIREEFSRAHAPMEPRGIGMMMLVPMPSGSRRLARRGLVSAGLARRHRAQSSVSSPATSRR